MPHLVTSDLLGRLAPSLPPPRVALFASVLDDALEREQVYTHRRIRHFLAQAMEETGALRGLVESTNYRDPVRLDQLFLNVQGVDHARRLIAAGPEAIANTIYANKNGNGGVASGDGFRYRGRGFLQITGRANYRRIGALVGMPLEDDPDLLGQPVPAAQAAAGYWKARSINVPADADDISAVTFLVNGPARLHLAERTAWLAKAKEIWADGVAAPATT
jgi:putative chitinase